MDLELRWIMYRDHVFEYAPILVGGVKKYIIGLPVEASPVRFWTITTPMRSWDGEVLWCGPERSVALVRSDGGMHPLEGRTMAPMKSGEPCVVMEHLQINGKIEYMISSSNIMDGGKNFVNFGIPNGRHVRIDIYTGESRIIDG